MMQQRMPMGGMMGQPMQRQQPMQMMQPQPQQIQQCGPDWIRVANLQQVEQVNVQPGQTAWIMVQSAPVFAVREADKVGLTTTDYYRFEKIDPSVTQQPQTTVVSPSEIEQLMARVKALEDEISEAKRRGAITESRKGD
jgi:hypothetical protein